jgi:hypothetical protein
MATIIVKIIQAIAKLKQHMKPLGGFILSLPPVSDRFCAVDFTGCQLNAKHNVDNKGRVIAGDCIPRGM